MSGVLRRIFLRPSARTPAQEAATAAAHPGAGLEGDHAGGGARQVTLISLESWRAACAELGREISPAGRRANLVVEGVNLAAAVGKNLTIGGVSIGIVGETRPCRLMEDYHPGLQRALDPDCRGGVYGRVLTGGSLSVGDPVEIAEPSNPQLEQLPLVAQGEPT
jgi:MOSC domain-containing protein YiiM